MVGNIVNTLAVVLGSILGLMMKKGISRRFQDILMHALGMCTLFVGISGALKSMLTVADGKLEVNGLLLLIISMVIGSVVGESINIEGRLNRLGERLKRIGGAGSSSSFTEGFVTGTLVICVGAMAIVGSISDGLGDPSTLFAKAALDAVVVTVFASTMGIGVLFSAVPMFLYQAVFNIVGMACGNIMSDALLANLSIVGNVLILGIGINLTFGTRIKVGNMLPALVIPAVWELFSLWLA